MGGTTASAASCNAAVKKCKYISVLYDCYMFFFLFFSQERFESAAIIINENIHFKIGKFIFL